MWPEGARSIFIGMARRSFLVALAGFGATFLCACGANSAAQTRPQSDSVPVARPIAASSVAEPAKAAEPPTPATPVSRVDSTGKDPRPQVVVEGIKFIGVRTRLIPRVMGKGWNLTVNKGDSIEFMRVADTAMSQALFGLDPQPGTRIRLRFRLKALPEGTRIETASHLVGRTGQLPYRASMEVLAQSLEELRQDLLTAPTSNAPSVDRVKARKKR
jgi:hypothetical protein